MSRSAAAERPRSRRGNSASTLRPSGLAALGATVVRVLHEEGLDHYGVAMADPEGNEFDVG
jgi:hypothetical protein